MGKKKSKEAAPEKFYPAPFTADRPTITFVVVGKLQPTNKLVLKAVHREIGIDDADKIFPTTGNVETDENVGYIFGPNVYRLRTIKEVQEIAGVDAKTARSYLALTVRTVKLGSGQNEREESRNEPADPVNFFRFCLDALYMGVPATAETVKEAA